MSETEQVLAVANFIVCGIGGFIVVCRLKFMSSRTKESIRYYYAMWLPLFAWSAISWTYGDVPGISQLALSCGATFQLILGSAAWKFGAPHYSQKPDAPQCSGD